MLENCDSLFEDYQPDTESPNTIPAIARIQQYKTEVGFRTLVEGVEDNLYVVPNFQRVYRWTFEQAESLATSLVLGLPIPPIYVYRNAENQLEILDGQQRIISLYLYYRGVFTKRKRSNQLELKHIGRGKEKFGKELSVAYDLEDRQYVMKRIYEGGKEEISINYKNLNEKDRRIVDYRTLSIVEINVDSNKDRQKILCKIFANLNAGGEPLSQQELRNGIYQCKFYDMVMNFNDTDVLWRKIYGNKDRRSEDIETLLRFCAMKCFTRFEDGEIHLVKFETYKQLLDDFSEKCQTYTDEQIESYHNALKKFVAQIPQNISKKRILWETLFLIIDKMNYSKKISDKLCNEIENNKEYLTTVTSGTTKKATIEKRLKCVYKILCEYY